MIFNLIIMLAALAFGIFLGFIGVLKEKLIIYNKKIINLTIYLLIFLMGIKIGVNNDVFYNMKTIGIDALVLAVFSIVGSYLAVTLFVKNKPNKNMFTIENKEVEGK